MGVIRKLLFVTFLVVSVTMQAQDAYVRHTVQKGETVHTIARQYNISAAELIRYNPDANSVLEEGTILIIPREKNQVDEHATELITHTVQPKETLYGLSKKYQCSVEEIIALNPEVKGGLKIGMVIKVPKKAERVAQDKDTVRYTYRVVEPKETVYSICKAAEISEEEFLRLNPEVKQIGLQIGQEIILPKGQVIEELASDTGKDRHETAEKNKKRFELYRIKPGDDINKIARKFNCTNEDIIRLNPELTSGIVTGRYIVVPVIEKVAEKPRVQKEEFERIWKVPSVYEEPEISLAVLAPLFLHDNDSLELTAFDENNIPVAEQSEIGLQFLTGVQIALDTLVSLGYHVNLEVFDTQNDLDQIDRIARQLSPETQLILGPLYSKSAERLAQLLPDRIIISPLSKSLDNQSSTNLVDCINNRYAEIDAVADIVNGCIDTSNIVFVHLDTLASVNAVERMNTKLGAVDSNWVKYVWVDQDFSQLQQLQSYLKPDTHNVLVSVDQNAAFLSDFIRKQKKRGDSITLVIATGRVFDIPTLENRYLNNLNFVGVKTEFLNTADSSTQGFIQKFRMKTDTEPSRFAYAGYDVGLYFTQLLADYGTIPEVANWPAWRGLNKGFNFEQLESEGPRNTFYVKARIVDYQMHIR
jgi:LysM repeat protein